MVNPTTYITHPWVRIPGFPDYAINTDEAIVCRVTPTKYSGNISIIAGDGSLPQHLWTPLNPFSIRENALGQVMLMPRGKGLRGVKRSIKNILKEIEG